MCGVKDRRRMQMCLHSPIQRHHRALQIKSRLVLIFPYANILLYRGASILARNVLRIVDARNVKGVFIRLDVVKIQLHIRLLLYPLPYLALDIVPALLLGSD